MSTRALRITALIALFLASTALVCSMQFVTNEDQQARALGLSFGELLLAVPLLVGATIPSFIAGGAAAQDAWWLRRRGWVVVLVFASITTLLAPVGAFEGLSLAATAVERGIALILVSHSLAVLLPVLVLIYTSTQPIDGTST